MKKPITEEEAYTWNENTHSEYGGTVEQMQESIHYLIKKIFLSIKLMKMNLTVRQEVLLEQQKHLGCTVDFDKVYIFSKKDELKEYILHSATVEGVFQYAKADDEHKIVGGAKDIKEGDSYYEVTVSYYNKSTEEFETKGLWVERSDFLLEEERNALVGDILSKDINWIVVSSKISIARELLKNTKSIGLEEFIQEYIEGVEANKEKQFIDCLMRFDTCIKYIEKANFDITGWCLWEIPIEYSYVFFHKEQNKMFDLAVFADGKITPRFLNADAGEEDANSIEEAIEGYKEFYAANE